MKVKLLKPWGFLEKGTVTEQPGPVAELLIGRKAAEEVREKDKKPKRSK